MYSKLGTPGVIASHALCDDDYALGCWEVDSTDASFSSAILYVNAVFGEGSPCLSIRYQNGERSVFLQKYMVLIVWSLVDAL